MPPWLTLSAVKDMAIVVAIILLGWWVYHSGENAVHVKDMRAMQKQVAAMQEQTDKWQQAVQNANATKQADLSAINSGAVIRPLHVELCDQPPDEVLPSTSATTATPVPQSRGSNVSSRHDIGPALQDYEKWIESEFAECRAAVASWPK